jgi:hypothetical protein
MSQKRNVLAGALLLACLRVPSAALTVSVAPSAYEIVREAPQGLQRLVYLDIANPSEAAVEGLTLVCQRAGGDVRREILPVPPGGAWDTVWLSEPLPESMPAALVQGSTTVWTGELRRPAEAWHRLVIPRSPGVALTDLKPLMLRGTNYYPRAHPWPGLWREMDEGSFEAEFVELEGLHINTIRTFYNLDVDAGLHRKDGAFTPLLLSRINTLLAVAARHHVKVMLCIGSAGDIKDFAVQRRFFRTGVEPFAYDGRVLMWDLINEPGGADGPKANPDLARWIQVMYEELGQVASGHLRTVGLCWQFDQLWALGVKPPVGQYHNYSAATGVQPEGQPPVRNVADDLRKTAESIDNRPLIIGEFGYASQVDAARQDASEATQCRITRDVLVGVEAAVTSGVNLVGVYNWCAFHFAPDWMGKGEQAFGVIRLDGTLKPAGEVLRDTYARWRGHVKAPWEQP